MVVKTVEMFEDAILLSMKEMRRTSLTFKQTKNVCRRLAHKLWWHAERAKIGSFFMADVLSAIEQLEQRKMVRVSRKRGLTRELICSITLTAEGTAEIERTQYELPE